MGLELNKSAFYKNLSKKLITYFIPFLKSLLTKINNFSFLVFLLRFLAFSISDRNLCIAGILDP